MIDDGHNVGQAFARPCPAGQYVRLAFLGLDDRFALMGVQQELLAGVVAVRLVEAKNLGTLRVKRLFLH